MYIRNLRVTYFRKIVDSFGKFKKRKLCGIAETELREWRLMKKMKDKEEVSGSLGLSVNVS